ncbi:MAG: 50S ribosomal protein L23 [Alphaproteobacteria bacterium]|nr:50S ribosomal protein L23 [Alphaproteobacteria bacterium]
MSWKYYNPDPKLTVGRLYNILRAPIVTEKSHLGGQFSQVTFLVAPDATKHEVAQAVQKLYNVTVTSVNTITAKGKNKSFRQRAGKRSDRKKAIVTLKAGQQIDLEAEIG